MAHPHKRDHEDHKESRAHRILGHYADEKEDIPLIKKEIRRAFKSHDKNLHGGKHEVLKFKTGGAVPGEAAGRRLDKPSRSHGKKGHAKTTVNVVVAGSHPQPQPVPVPVPQRPPMGGAPVPGGAMPPGAAAGVPGAGPVPMMRKRGGGVGKEYEAGAGSAEGRDEKIKAYGDKFAKGRKH